MARVHRTETAHRPASRRIPSLAAGTYQLSCILRLDERLRAGGLLKISGAAIFSAAKDRASPLQSRREEKLVGLQNSEAALP